MKFEFIETKVFDVDKERKRINRCFKDKPVVREKLERIVDLFCETKFQECLDVINSLGYDREDECDEKEYLSIFIQDNMWELCVNPDLRIKVLPEN